MSCQVKGLETLSPASLPCSGFRQTPPEEAWDLQALAEGVSTFGSCCALWRKGSGTETKAKTDVIKQNLSLIGKCQQQYKRWSDDS